MRRLAITLVAIFFACPIYAQEWGDLTVRFLYDGEPPKLKALPISNDKQVCKEGELFDESLVVNDKDRGIANVVMWLSQAKGDAAAPVHSAFAESEKSVVSLVTKNCRFEPHVVLVRTSQVLTLRNDDPIGHNFVAYLENNDSFNHLNRSTGETQLQFTAGERLPTKLKCGIHPWMQGWLFIHDDPYMAVSDASGKLQVKNVPAGKWTFRVWHERKGYIRQFVRGGQTIELPQQGWPLQIMAGENELGEVLLKAQALERK